MQVQLSLFTDDKSILLKCWSSQNKVLEQYAKENPSKSQLTTTLKEKYGVGGFASPLIKPNYVNRGVYNSSGIELAGFDDNGNVLTEHFTWSDVASEIINMIKNDTAYYDQRKECLS
ncbi:hypothetical protein [Metasolibacillus meyeri]|uniref:hypothetical protein n=1 Tax=Metasolibacillus meyeri TaxID=1071052 RepID=UPI000D30F664|nr:hypothetical protein [Metasolibacillus meyeri]